MINSTNLDFWFGEIEDANDPMQNGRYRVRVFGHNTPDTDLLPTDDLPWFPILSMGAASAGVGYSPTFYQVGTHVLGAYLDKEHQHGIIFGSFFANNVFNDATGNSADQFSNCDETQADDSANDENVSSASNNAEDIELVKNIVTWAVSHIKPYRYSGIGTRATGDCARYVNEAFRNNGLSVYGDGKDSASNIIKTDKYVSVAYSSSYEPVYGDVMSLIPKTGATTSSAGHVAIYNGTNWYSDFKQRNRGNTCAPGSAYEKGIDKGYYNIVIARHKDVKSS